MKRIRRCLRTEDSVTLIIGLLTLAFLTMMGIYEDVNPLCGDRIRMELNIGADQIIAMARFRGDSCIISRAAASILTEFATTTSTIETRAASNDRNHKVAFYAAELALSTGETIVEHLPSRAEFNENSITGRFAEGGHPGWINLDWFSASIEIGGLPHGLSQTASLPRYTLEQRNFKRDSLTIGIGIPTGIHRFNVVARGADRSNRTLSVLQTIYAKRF